MAILRSLIVGDVDRLLRSKNEWLKYYFSELKPWNPGLLAVQREVWIQMYGIPLHIWGDISSKWWRIDLVFLWTLMEKQHTQPDLM
jgi:hypothetical protein